MQYELTFLLNEEAELKNIKDLIEAQKGKVLIEEKWGKKTLCYLIKKLSEANFYNWTIEIEEKNVQELRKKLNFNEKMIRYLLLQKEMSNVKVQMSKPKLKSKNLDK